MCYIFESIDRNGSQKRIIYNRFRSALWHSWCYKCFPKIKRDANDIR